MTISLFFMQYGYPDFLNVKFSWSPVIIAHVQSSLLANIILLGSLHPLTDKKAIFVTQILVGKSISQFVFKGVIIPKLGRNGNALEFCNQDPIL